MAKAGSYIYTSSDHLGYDAIVSASFTGGFQNCYPSPPYLQFDLNGFRSLFIRKNVYIFCVSYAILILARKSRIIRIAIAELTNKVSTNTKMAEELLGGL